MFPIIGQRFNPTEFAAYVAGISLEDFVPNKIVIHNTASPDLTDRPHGFTREHMENLRSYYAKTNGWSGGPHCFIDDTERGIWVFNPLDRPGVHSPSWNQSAWGVEHLGDYDTDDPTTGRGAAVIANGVAAVRVLLAKLGLVANAETVRFHYEDAKTTHACPGKKLTKAAYLALLQAGGASSPGLESGWTVYGPDGQRITSGLPTGPQGTGLVRACVESVGGQLKVDGSRREIRLAKA